MTDTHLEGLTLIEKRLVKNYATTIMGGVHTLANVPVKLRPYVELEIALREIAILNPETPETPEPTEGE